MSVERLLIHRPPMAPLSPPVCFGHLILICDLTRRCASLVVRTAESSRCLQGKSHSLYSVVDAIEFEERIHLFTGM
ncbi:hypothetical protein E5288_WYG012390 [Bos mutus]|uniref:Uncharacterized protein n=1 Tax=Bos mutus TaxID=72004 RepID=A0A6B0RY93_9CETA|nr:hypothetical protein [Bos mutus]